MEHVRITETPLLTRPLVIAAFGGWNDAASAATWAVKFLINQWDAQPFADIDPEPFYDFAETRPRVTIASGSMRKLTWPTNRFYACHTSAAEESGTQRDVVLVLGEEPQLKWRTFAAEVMGVCRTVHAEDVVLLGSLVAEVPHTAPVQVSASTSRASILRRMADKQIERAGYDGETGILSVLQDAARKEGYAATSLWGVAPHYVSAQPNLPVSEALLRKLDALYECNLSLKDLGRAARRFTQRVSSLVAEDPDVSAYVRELEKRGTSGGREQLGFLGDASGIHRIPMDGELPSPDEAIQSVEDYLRGFRDGGDAD